jgi:DNA-binding MarR family transcriptional regulator
MTAQSTDQEPATEALLALSSAMTAVVARSLAEARAVSIPQLRVLVLVESRGPMNVKALAEHLGVNASNASRTCERLVASGLLERGRLPQQDRRTVVLRLTGAGVALVGSLMESRRAILAAVVARMSTADRQLLVRAFAAVSDALAAAPEAGAIGRPDGRLIPWLL